MNKKMKRIFAWIVLHSYCASIMAGSFETLHAASNSKLPQDVFMSQYTKNGSDRGIDLRAKNAITVYPSKSALVIGNSNYPDSPLKNPQNDASDMAENLGKLGFDVTLLIDGQKQDMISAVRDFTQKLKEHHGVGLFYFAGHGMQVSGRNYLIPVDGDIEQEHDIKYEAIDVGRVLDGMEKAGNSANILILDACRNNPYSRSFRSSSQGLALLDSPTGTLLSYSTSPGRLAKDGDGRNGIYTKHLLIEMMQPGATIESTLKRVRAGVMAQTNNEQTPWESSSLTVEFYFNGGDGSAKVVYASGMETLSPTNDTTEPEVYKPKFETQKAWYEQWFVWLIAGVAVVLAGVALSNSSGGDGGDGGGSGGGAGGSGG